MKQELEKLWNRHVYQRGLSMFCLALYPFSLLYLLLTVLKRGLNLWPGYRIQVANPVISVGNLTVGGSGKTPFVQWLIGKLIQQGQTPILITRGYGATYSGEFARYGQGKWDKGGFFGDELEMLLRKFPEIRAMVGKRRALLALEASKQDDQSMLILEDAFQYWRMARDLDIVLINCSRLFGNGLRFPAGPLRELPHALLRADILVLMNPAPDSDDLLAMQDYLKPGAEIFSMFTSIKDCGLKGFRVIALASIADPPAFQRDLMALGAVVVELVTPGDHGRLSNAEQLALIQRVREGEADYLCMTSKDEPKWEIWEPCVKVVPQVIEVQHEDRLLHIIQEKITQKKALHSK